MTHPSLPHRFTERAFRNYEPTIAMIVSQWPSVIELRPSNSLETFTQRLRDAIRSYHDFNWPSTIDRVKFMNEVYKNFSLVTNMSGTVTVCNKREKASLTAIVVNVVKHTPVDDSKMLGPTKEEIMTNVENLLARKMDSFEAAGCSAEVSVFIESLPHRYDIAVTQLSPGTYKII